MDNKMLIDADHPEETRVVVVRGNRVEEFDFEAENKKQLRGNIYLAKVTRVEPSLQAAFVDYGGNRHGFLAFSEIHPDYYQIPVADRQALLEEEAAANKEANSDEDEDKPKERKRRSSRKKPETKAAASSKDDTVSSDVVEEPAKDEAADDPAETAAEDATTAAEAPSETPDTEDASSPQTEASTEDDLDAQGDEANDEATPSSNTDEASEVEAVEAKDDVVGETVTEDAPEEEEEAPKPQRRTRRKPPARSRAKKADEEKDDDNGDDDDDAPSDEDDVESVGSEDALEEVPERRSRPRIKQYKIQEVIKRRQIILVQVVKEERGNKGAALTTYLSLAGRYSVLMPNTDRGGGISRKITNQTDRKRLRTIASDLDVPEGMGVILRTAGASRTKTEIKRDFEYLMRLWENVRDLTLKSSAPALVYEEGSLLKRSIRDLYNKDIKQVLVSGDEGYREAKDFMRMLMPSHAKNVQPYKESHPIFARYNVEAQLDAMFSPQVTLRSGGYIVINQTEALVSIDVNSGRSTRERSIEDTALSTNLEAAEEVARQLRLRDLAGLVVIDFIDMEEKRNNRAVERKLKECLRNDRARIQVGRISHFGLLEMSRQRIRAGVLESTMDICPHCQGTGYIRAPASVALYVLRAIEEYLLKGSKYNVIVRTPTQVALYVLNQKRAHLSDLEERFGLTITLEADESVLGDYCQIVRGDRADEPKLPPMVTPNTIDIDAELARDAELDAAAEEEERKLIADDSEADDGGTRKRRRRRRRGGRDDEPDDGEETVEASSEDGERDEDDTADGDEERKKKRRRRGRRGGRRERERKAEIAAKEAERDGDTADSEGGEPTDADAVDAAPASVAAGDDNTETEANMTAAASEETSVSEDGDVTAEPQDAKAEPEKPKRARSRSRKKVAEPEAEVASSDDEASEGAQSDDAPAEAEAPEAQAEASADAAEESEAVQVAEEEAANAETDEPAAEEKPKKPARSGWWQRRSFF